MTEPKPNTTRRQFLERRRGGHGVSPGGCGRAVRSMRRRTTRSRSHWWAAAAGHRRGSPTPCRPPKARSNWWPWPTSSKTGSSQLQPVVEKHGDKKIDVTEEHKFIGFDAYQKAMDCLKPGDVVIFATPPAFRWVHFTYAIQKDLHTFMEKPISVDGPTTRRMLALAEAGQEEEPESRRRADVPPLRSSRRAVQPHQGGPDRRRADATGLPPRRAPVGIRARSRPGPPASVRRSR